jgi:hypothetical protein
MKKLIVVLLCLVTLNGFSQGWHVSKDTLIMESGAKFVEKGKVKLGYGSNTNKDFAYIATNPYSLAGRNQLDKSYANLNMTIKEIKVLHNKRFGDKVFLIVKGVAFATFWVDIVAAIDQKEVIIE